MARGRSSNSTRVFSAASSGGKTKRRERPAKQGKVEDAYTFVPELPKRHRTSAAQLSLSREEADVGPKRHDEDEEDMSERIRRVAMMIAGDDVGTVEDDDDSDVDSDVAWDSEGSAEERWGGVFRDLKRGKGKKGKEVVKKPAKPITVNLDETDEESDPEVERSPRTAFKSAFPDEDEEDEDEEEEDDDDEEMEAEGDDESSDEEFNEDPELPSDLSDDDDGMDGLEDFVDSLATADKKRKAEDDEPEQGKKRRVLPVVSAPGVSDSGDLALKSKSKVDLSSLIASAEGLDAKALLPSKSEKKSTSVLKGGVLAAPLPTVVQSRLDREVAYEKTKEEGQKWSGAMKRVKEAEHLSFPLQATERGGVKSAGEMVATFKANNAHESAVEALLAQANLTDKGVAAAEDAALRGQDLSIEEIAARRAELRHQRELMFRAESRAKRVAKIKSKTFRKLARKREARGAEKAGEISLEDLERLDPQAAAEERERLERERARERATLRHGARTGRWARDADGIEAEEDSRMAKLEMLEMKERLQRKIHGDASGSESGTDESGDEDEDDIKSAAFDQLAKLNGDVQPEPTKGIAGMAFMKKAAEREMKKVREAEAAFRAELDEEEVDSDDDSPQMMKVGEGRMVFAGPTPGAGVTPTESASAPASAPAPRSPSPEPVLFGAGNPWLEEGGGSGPSRKRNLVSTSAEAKAVRSLKKAGKDKAAMADDEVVEISLDLGTKPKAAPPQPKSAPQPKSILKKPKADAIPAAAPAAPADGDSDSDSDNDELLPISGVKAFTQRELVAEAFAGDNVVEDFAAEKARAIAADAPVVEDTTLVGWGSWGGKGVKKSKRAPNPRFLKTSKGVQEEDRKDAGRSNVIITEKRDRKATKHLPADLPYPYTSVAQYEASFANPVGGEWNSRAAYQRQTLPRVTKKPGAIIEPVRKLF